MQTITLKKCFEISSYRNTAALIPNIMRTLKRIYSYLKSKWQQFENFMEPYGAAAASVKR